MTNAKTACTFFGCSMSRGATLCVGQASGQSFASTDRTACVVFLRPLGRHLRAGQHVVDRLGDVGGVIADPLDVLGAEQQMRAGRDVARVFHHVGQQFAKQRGVHRVDLVVAVAHEGEAVDRSARHRRPARP